MEELKPCPFCGGEAKEIHPPEKGYWIGFWRIRCTSCGAMLNGSHRGMNVEAWNRRANEHDIDELLKVADELEVGDIARWNLDNIAIRIRKALGFER